MDQGIGIRRHSGTLLRVGNLSGHSIEIRVYWAQCLPNAPGQFQVLLLQLDRGDLHQVSLHQLVELRVNEHVGA